MVYFFARFFSPQHVTRKHLLNQVGINENADCELLDSHYCIEAPEERLTFVALDFKLQPFHSFITIFVDYLNITTNVARFSIFRFVLLRESSMQGAQSLNHKYYNITSFSASEKRTNGCNLVRNDSVKTSGPKAKKTVPNNVVHGTILELKVYDFRRKWRIVCQDARENKATSISELAEVF